MSKAKSIFTGCVATVLLLLANHAIAQDESAAYTIQIGNFAKPDLADFSNLSDIGYIYAGKAQDNYTSVFMGGYTSEAAAEKIVATLKEKGYANAFTARLELEQGSPVAVVQLATRRFNEKIDWDAYAKAGQLYLVLSGDQVKILTGIFPDIPTAKQQLPRIHQAGIKDAFAKTVNNALLHEVTVFEAGNSLKKPLIQLNLPENPAVAGEQEDPRPAGYETQPAVVPQPLPDLAAKGVPAAEVVPKPKAAAFAPAHPSIRGEVKRTAALELQKALKATGNYTGSLDGYFGKDSKTALARAYNASRQLRKYALLSREGAATGSPGSLQAAIDQLRDQPEASLKVLEASRSAIAMAYKACHLLVTKGLGKEVNQLMNQALRDAFPAGKSGIANFDPAATYAYEDMGSLLQHLSYIHRSAPGLPAVPCWLFREFPGPALKAFAAAGTGGEPALQPCGGFWEWEEVKLLNAILTDISPQSEYKGLPSAVAMAQLHGLCLSPVVPAEKDRKPLEAWSAALWQGIGGWSTRDPVLGEMAAALRISFFHTSLLLEDYFMDEGFNEREAKALALSAMKALTGDALRRFI